MRTMGDNYDFNAGCDDPSKSGQNQRYSYKALRMPWVQTRQKLQCAVLIFVLH